MSPWWQKVQYAIAFSLLVNLHVLYFPFISSAAQSDSKFIRKFLPKTIPAQFKLTSNWERTLFPFDYRHLADALATNTCQLCGFLVSSRPNRDPLAPQTNRIPTAAYHKQAVADWLHHVYIAPSTICNPYARIFRKFCTDSPDECVLSEISSNECTFWGLQTWWWQICGPYFDNQSVQVCPYDKKFTIILVLCKCLQISTPTWLLVRLWSISVVPLQSSYIRWMRLIVFCVPVAFEIWSERLDRVSVANAMIRLGSHTNYAPPETSTGRSIPQRKKI